VTRVAAPDPLPALRADPYELLTGRELRTLTARAVRARADAGPGELVVDVAYAAVSALLAAGLVAGAANLLREALVVPAAAGDAVVLGPAAVAGLLGGAFLALALGTALRLGPLGVGSAGARWWLPAPSDRRGLLVPSFRRALGAGAGAGAVAGAVVALAAGGLVADVARGALATAVATTLLVVVAGLAQPHARAAARVARAADVAVAAVPVVGVALVLAGVGGGTAVLVPAPAVVAVVAAGTVALAAWWWTRAERLGAPVLRAQGSVMDQVGGAVLSVDVRALGRALEAPGQRRVRRTAALRTVRGPATALVAADLVLLRRSPTAVAHLVGLAALLAVAPQVPALATGAGAFVVLVVAGLRAAQLGAQGARAADLVPVLDALVPLGARAGRLARTVVPALAAAGCLVVGALPLALGAGDGRWLALAALTGVVQGAAAVRSAYRRPPDWSAPLLATPAGGIPTGAAAALRVGPDVALLGSVPLGVALLVGAPGWGAVLAQGLAALVALAVASRVPRR